MDLNLKKITTKFFFISIFHVHDIAEINIVLLFIIEEKNDKIDSLCILYNIICDIEEFKIVKFIAVDKREDY